MNLYRKWGLVVFSAMLALLVALANSASALADDYQCTGFLGAVSVDNLFVPQDASCTLTGTHVDGSIIVESNATLHAYDVRVDGNLQADNAARVNVYAGSSVNGSIQIIDSGAAEILSVDINGDLFFDDNDQLLIATANDIGGNLQAFSNTGGVTITGNTIDGNLQCKDNSPPPTGLGNIVSGSMEDQCANFGGNPPPAPTDSPPLPTNTPTPTQSPPSPTPTATQTAPSPTQSALVANEDVYTLTERQIFVTAPGILENDLVPGSDTVEVILVQPPQFGTLTLGQNGDFTYQVQSGYFGEDTFVYSLRSAGIVSNPVTVRIVMVDQEAPSVLWISPVPAGDRYDMHAGDQAVLEVEASDNFGLEKVTFMRWDAVQSMYVILAEQTQPPFRVTVSARSLNPDWNQVFVSATDLAGNLSARSHVWLYKLDRIQAVSQIFVPFIQK